MVVGKEIDPTPVGRSSLPQTTGVQQARVDAAIRTLADEAGRRLSRGWSEAVKAAARDEHLPDALDRRSPPAISISTGTAGGGS